MHRRVPRSTARATVEPVLTSNSSVVSSVDGGCGAAIDADACSHGRDDAVDLVERQRRGGQHGRPVGVADRVAQLRGDGGPARVPVTAMQVRASQAAGHAGHHQRPDQTGAVANPHRQVRYPRGVQLPQHPRVGNQ